jgi:hypothetical protein
MTDDDRNPIPPNLVPPLHLGKPTVGARIISRSKRWANAHTVTVYPRLCRHCGKLGVIPADGQMTVIECVRCGGLN